MSEARVRVSRANATGFRVELWDVGFPSAGLAPVAQGEFPASHFDDDSVNIALEAIRNQLTPGPEFQTAGQRIFDAIQASGLEAAWQVRRQQGCLTYLEIDDANLSALPWELMGFSRQGIFRRLFANPNSPIVRVHPPGDAQPLGLDATIRVLLLPGEALAGDDTFPAAEFCTVLRQFQACQHCVHVEVAETLPVDAEAIAALLDEVRPHIVHFLGHGEVNPHTDLPALVFNVPGNKWWWDSDAIYQQLSTRKWVPRLVVLNACHSSQITGLAGNMAPVATAFAAAGVAAVVAMQATVTIDRAQDFAEAFYGYLSNTGKVDTALAEARNSLGNANGSSGWARRDWALPVLSVALPASEILKPKALPDEVANCPILGRFQATSGPAAFVGRTLERRKLLAALRPFDPSDSPATCLILEGPGESGKSWLVYRYARDVAVSGVLVRHVDLSANTAYDTISLMERVLAGAGASENPLSLVHSPLPLATFTDFQAQAAAYKTGSKDLNALRRVCEAWRKGLEALAAPNRMLLVLDQLRGSNGGIDGPEFQLALLSEFVLPIANNPQSPILLTLVIRAEDNAEYGLSNIAKARRVSVDRLAPQAFEHLFYEFCRFKTNKALAGLKAYISEDRATGPWSPSVFRDFAPMVKKHV